MPAVAAGPDGPATLLLEVGSEELPPQDIDAVVGQLRSLLASALDEARLSYETLEVWGTPRRVVAQVGEVAPRQADRVVRVRGPRVDVAFDADGEPTPAGLGFARKQGVAVGDLDRELVADVPYVVAERMEAGVPAVDALAEALPGVVGSLRFSRSMRWQGPETYPRPLRWIVAMLGDAVVPFVHGSVVAGRTTRVLRDEEPSAAELRAADDLLPRLEASGIVVVGDDRRRYIVEDAGRLAAEVGGSHRRGR